MDFEKLTNKSKSLVQDVVNLASQKKHQYIAPEHILKTLLDDKDTVIAELLENPAAMLIISAGRQTMRLPKFLRCRELRYKALCHRNLPG